MRINLELCQGLLGQLVALHIKPGPSTRDSEPPEVYTLVDNIVKHGVQYVILK
jgi:hypothetical protein